MGDVCVYIIDSYICITYTCVGMCVYLCMIWTLCCIWCVCTIYMCFIWMKHVCGGTYAYYIWCTYACDTCGVCVFVWDMCRIPKSRLVQWLTAGHPPGSGFSESFLHTTRYSSGILKKRGSPSSALAPSKQWHTHTHTGSGLTDKPFEQWLAEWIKLEGTYRTEYTYWCLTQILSHN